MFPKTKISLYCFLVPFVCFALGYLFIVPLGQTPDEPAHLGYIEFVSQNHRLPTLDQLETAHHPPAYYLIASLVLSLTKNPFWLRLFSLSLSFVNLLTINRYQTLVSTKKTFNQTATLIVSLIPMYVFMSIAINNDALSNLLASALIWFGLIGFDRSLTHSQWLAFALITSLAIFTKVVLLPVLILTAIILFWQQPKKRVQLGIFFLFLGAAFIFFWIGRNVRLYGTNDWLGWVKLSQINPPLVGNNLLRNNPRQWLVLLFHSFWGIFGWFAVYLPVQIYTWLRRVTILLLPFFLIEIKKLWHKSHRNQRKQLLALLAFFLVIVLAVGRDNLNFFHPQGRYLFPVIGIIGFYYGLAFTNLHRLFSTKLSPKLQRISYFLFLLGPLLYLNLVSLKMVWQHFYP